MTLMMRAEKRTKVKQYMLTRGGRLKRMLERSGFEVSVGNDTGESRVNSLGFWVEDVREAVGLEEEEKRTLLVRREEIGKARGELDPEGGTALNA